MTTKRWAFWEFGGDSQLCSWISHTSRPQSLSFFKTQHFSRNYQVIEHEHEQTCLHDI